MKNFNTRMIIKKYYYIIQIILLFIICPFSHFLNAEDNTRNIYQYNFRDIVFSQSNFLMYLNDDWGIKGSISAYGLPTYATNFYYNNIQGNDPLYGSLPFTWINPRYTNVEMNSGLLSCSLKPVWNLNDSTYSRFDYYKGDYSFGVFGLLLGGKFGENSYWRFHGENFKYDGLTGNYGPEFLIVGENISQIYSMDIKSIFSNWNFNTGISFNKYFTSVINPDDYGIIDNFHYLSWTHNGRNNEHKIASYLTLNSIGKEDSLSAGLQISNYIYENNENQGSSNFKGEGSEYSGFFKKYFSFGERQYSFSLSSLKNTMFFRNENNASSTLLTGLIGLDWEKSKTRIKFDFGFSNLNFNWNVDVNKKFSEKTDLSFFAKQGYFFYEFR